MCCMIYCVAASTETQKRPSAAAGFVAQVLSLACGTVSDNLAPAPCLLPTISQNQTCRLSQCPDPLCHGSEQAANPPTDDRQSWSQKLWWNRCARSDTQSTKAVTLKHASRQCNQGSKGPDLTGEFGTAVDVLSCPTRLWSCTTSWPILYFTHFHPLTTCGQVTKHSRYCVGCQNLSAAVTRHRLCRPSSCETIFGMCMQFHQSRRNLDKA